MDTPGARSLLFVTFAVALAGTPGCGSRDASAATAGHASPEAAPAPRSVVVQTTATAHVAPEVADLEFTVEVPAPTGATPTTPEPAAVEAVRSALTRAGIASDRIKLKPPIVKPIPFAVRGGQPQAWRIGVRKVPLDTVRRLTDAAREAGASVETATLTPKDPVQAAAQARAAAVEQARREAEVLAAAAGSRLGPVLEIDASEPANFADSLRRIVRKKELADPGLDPSTVQIKATPTVRVRFALE